MAEPVCYQWQFAWPHAVANIGATRTTMDASKVTCQSCLWALGSQKGADPMDSPPADHGSDRHGYVELVGAPQHVVPDDAWVDQLLASCGDCNLNLFLYWRPKQDPPWHVEYAHDTTCPNPEIPRA